jgi:hypothetical protein
MDGKTPITTDESLYESSILKDRINQQLLMAIKETAMDCRLYSTGSKESVVCYDFGKVASNQFASYPTLIEDIQTKDAINQVKEVVGLEEVKIRKVKYMMDRRTKELYNYERYQETKGRAKPDLFLEGTLVRQEDGFRIIK